MKVLIAILLSIYCSSGSTQSYLKYDLPLETKNSLYTSELNCLASTLYFESRGLKDRSMALVGVTTLNRASSLSGASTVCATVKKKRSKTSCDYSWWCDGKSDVMKDLTQRNRAYRIAQEVLAGEHVKLTKATHFVHCSVVEENSSWLKNMKYLGRDRDSSGRPAHCFYKNRDRA